MELIYNDRKVLYALNERIKLMDVIEFVKTYQYAIDKLYIDKFWESISNNDWLLIDYEMLRWMGYGYSRDRENKQYYVLLLENNFKRPEDYDIVSKEDTRVREGTLAKPRNNVLVRAKTFKRSLMMLRTEKATQIRDYFMTLEEILIDYMKYTSFVNSHNHDMDTTELKSSITDYKSKLDIMERTHRELAELSFDQTPLEYDEYLYIITSKRYYPLNLFKIGKTVNLKSRLITYNTGTALNEDELFYLCAIPTSDSNGLERILRKALINFKHQKEWYRIQQKDLFEIVQYVIKQQKELKDTINQVIGNQSNEDNKSIEMERFAELHLRDTESMEQKDDIKPSEDTEAIEPISEGVQSINDLKCPRCDKVYKKSKPLQNHINRNVCGGAPSSEHYNCSRCNQRFTSLKRCQNHVAICISNRFTCSRCGVNCVSQCALDRHLSRKYLCKVKP